MVLLLTERQRDDEVEGGGRGKKQLSSKIGGTGNDEMWKYAVYLQTLLLTVRL
jgi:hypothetical protein